MRGESMKDKSKKSTYSTTFGVDPDFGLKRAGCSIGKNKKRRKFLQDSAPANWEQQGGNLSPLIQKSEKISESQWEILENFGKNEAQDSSDVRGYKKPEYRETYRQKKQARLPKAGHNSSPICSTTQTTLNPNAPYHSASSKKRF